MYLRFRVVFLPLVAGLALLTAGCPSTETISKINSNPARYKDKEVVLVGKVTDSYGVFGKGIYEIDDGTGTMWVATQNGVPERGTRVGTKGYIITGFNFNGRSI